MRPKEEEIKQKTGTFILSEKIDNKKTEKELKKEQKKREKEEYERRKRERKIKEKEERERKEREKFMRKGNKGKVVCASCGGKCSGEVLRVADKYFHTACFICRTCSCSLAKGGFFCKDNHYYCPQDYQKMFGTRCAACGEYVEGEVVTALGNTYHQKCFTCARCRRAFPSGEKVTYTGREVVCSNCLPTKETTRSVAPHLNNSLSPIDAQNECAGCGKELAEGQALIALDRQWHTTCFACGACGVVLQGEYMGRDGIPYCEKDYQKMYGVRCAHCDRYISGKVLQAGEKHHFHPTCARCSKCGAAFGDGEEMFLQGAAVWHPRCGPRPGDELSRPDSQYSLRSRTPSANGSIYSPYSSLNRKHWPPASPTARVTAYSYLAADAPPLRKPLAPRPPPPDQHFHRPPSSASYHDSSRSSSRQRARPGMTYLVDSMRSETPRPKSPGMNNEEPIELSHYPAAYKPPPGTKSKIERDDFPAPPYPYTDPERRRRYSDTYKGVSDDEDETDGKQNGHAVVDEKLEREKRELSKLESGIARVFLKEVREREKLRQWRKKNLDPRNASRTPSATREPVHSLRYSSPVGASPSRTLHAPLTDESLTYPRSHSAASHVPSYNVLHGAPRPGYGLKSSTLPATMRTNGYPVDFTFSGLGDKTHSTDFSSGKSDISVGSITDVDRSAVTAAEYAAAPRSGATWGCGGATWGGGGGASRRSLPNMINAALMNEPAKLYPYHLLLITNYRLPPDVDRLNLERHLSDAEFEAILQIGRADFYRLPQWRRNELKRRARLF